MTVNLTREANAMFIVSLQYIQPIEEVDRHLADPFCRNRVAEYDITEFQVTKHDERFGVFLAP